MVVSQTGAPKFVKLPYPPYRHKDQRMTSVYTHVYIHLETCNYLLIYTDMYINRYTYAHRFQTQGFEGKRFMGWCFKPSACLTWWRVLIVSRSSAIL